MTRCPQCHIDKDLCSCPFPTTEPLEVLVKLKMYHEKKAEEYARLIREELLKKKLRL